MVTAESVPAISQKVLFVDDEPRLLEAIKRQLRREFDVYVAEGGARGLSMLAEQGPFALVISDYNMPTMDGIEFLCKVRDAAPQTVLAMLTGRAELDLAIKALHHAKVSRFLSKPCPKELMVQTIADCLEQYRLAVSEKQLQLQLALTNQELNELNQDLEKKVNDRTAALRTQYHYVSSLTKMEDCGQIVDAILVTTAELLKTQEVALFVNYDGNNDHFLERTLDGCTGDSVAANEIDDGGAIAQILAQKKSVFFDDNQAFSASDRRFFMGQPRACFPLLTDKSIVGLLTISGNEVIAADDTLRSSLETLINATASSLVSHWHLEARNEAQDAIISALAKLSEYRDSETGAHLLRIKKYCALICDLLAQTERYKDQVTERFKADLVRSSPMHDIGKVGIPDAILKKPGQLTDAEFDIMKQHATIGGDTLRVVFEQFRSQTFIKSGMEVAYYHHEKWDGSGYPYQLAGEEIPLSARILTVADVYDALTTKRVYKPVFPRETAKQILEEGSGTHFDPAIIAVFSTNEPSFYAIAQSTIDEPIPGEEG